MPATHRPLTKKEKIQAARRVRIGPGYYLVRPIAKGSFGSVSIGRDAEHDDKSVAIKYELLHDHIPLHLNQDIAVYKQLAGEFGFPEMFWYGSSGDYRVMVFELLGDTLHSYKKKCGGRLSLKTTLMIADQLISRIEVVHAKGYIHRDIKPENVLMGRGPNNVSTVYLTDFGLSVRCDEVEHQYDSDDSEPPFNLCGTSRFASINAHYATDSQLSDDLESLGYTLIYLLRGYLPWNNASQRSISTSDSTSSDSAEAVYIARFKKQTSISELCAHLPKAFAKYMRYVRRLEHDTPNYGYLRGLFRELWELKGYRDNGVFDWHVVSFNRRVSKKEGLPPIDDREYAGLKDDAKKWEQKGMSRWSPFTMEGGKACLDSEGYDLDQTVVPESTMD